MNLLRSLVFVLLLGTLPVAAFAKDYGSGVGNGEVVKISSIYENPAKFVGKTLVVEGTIVEVCRARGCWMDIAGDKAGQTLKIKVEDGVIVFPLEGRGKKAKVQGILEELKLSKGEALEEARHRAKESGKPFNQADVREGVSYRIKATGAVIP